MLKELIAEKDISNKLLALGNTPDEVAANLNKFGVKGIRKKSCYCPIANYVSGLIGKEIAVNCYVILSLTDWESVTINNDVVSVFVRNFDRGKYPELEEKTSK